MSTCECSPCGRKFTGLTTFDKHQDVDYKRRPAVRCIDPSDLGMRLDKHGRWGFPPDASKRATFDKMRAEQPPAGVIGREP